MRTILQFFPLLMLGVLGVPLVAQAAIEYCYTFTMPGGTPEEQCRNDAASCETARAAIAGAATSISGSCYEKGAGVNQCTEAGFQCIEQERCGNPQPLAGCGVQDVCCDRSSTPTPEPTDPADPDDPNPVPTTPDDPANPADPTPDPADPTPDPATPTGATPRPTDVNNPTDAASEPTAARCPDYLGSSANDVGSGAGLVSCGNNVEVQCGVNADGKTVYRYIGECSVCDFQTTLMLILNFLVTTMVAVAGILFANAGFYYLTAQGNAAKVSKAHKLFMNTLTGLVIVLAAYLLVDVFMKTLVSNDGDINNVGPWNQILCDEFSTSSWYDIEQLETTTVSVEEYKLHAVGPGWDPVGDVALDPVTGLQTLTIDAKNAGYQNLSNNCSVGSDSCVDYITAQAMNHGVSPSYAVALAIIESGGCSNPATCGSGAGAIGVIQLLPGTAREMCGSACAGMSNAQMVQQLRDPRKNIEWGVKYMAQSDRYVTEQMAAHPERFESSRKNDYMAAYYNGGPGALEASNDCGPSKTKYECTINPGGYLETQRYVANMNKITGQPLNPVDYTTGGGF